MKRILAITVLYTVINVCQAQDNELSISYSPLSVYGLEKFIDDIIPDQNTYRYLGAFNLDYYHYVNPWLKIGVNTMYDKASVEGLSYSNQVYNTSKTAFVIAPQVDFEYVRHENFRLSSGLSVGYGVEKHKDNNEIGYNEFIDGITFHANLISFRWGKNHGLAGCLGAGYKGFVNIGYFVRF